MFCTSEDHVNIKKQCTYKYVSYGQLRNKYLHGHINGHANFGLLRCAWVSDDTMNGTGYTEVQDFIPRKFSFSFGFRCDEINPMISLRGLAYEVNIYGTNETLCLGVHTNSTCYHYAQYGVTPNLMGRHIVVHEMFFSQNRILEFLFKYKTNCYQHFHEFSCYVNIPKCDPISKQVIHPCMCYDAKNACGSFKKFNCDYLQSFNGSVECLYYSVWCGEPPKVQNATVSINCSNIAHIHYLNDKTEYSCDEGFEMEGNKTITCMYSGHWSTPPKCSLKQMIQSTPSQNMEQRPLSVDQQSFSVPLPIVLPSFLIPLAILLLVFCMIYQIKLRTKRKCSLKMEKSSARCYSSGTKTN